MSLSFNQAVDAIFGQFRQYWIANAPSIVGSIPAPNNVVPPIYYQGLSTNSNPANTRYWCRISVDPVRERQASLGVVEAVQKRRYTAEGLVFVQLFAPISDGQAGSRGRALAEIAQRAFRGKKAADEVIFYNVRINQLDPEDGAFRWNIVAEYEYDDIG